MDESLLALWDARRPAALRADAAALPDPSLIPPRQWLFGVSLVRRFVSVLVAPGGVGKSALALAQCVSIATGRAFLAEKVHHAAPCWMLNLEDPLEEMNRRLAGLLLHHRIEPAELAGRLFLHSGRTRRLCIARPGPDGGIIHPDRDAIIEQARAHGIGCIMVDPFVKSHALEENSNTDMDAAATAWAEVAEATGAAVQLVHHVRKGAGTAGDVDVARGGKALTDAARVAQVMAPMTAEEAALLGIEQSDRWRHVRLDDAKANLSPRAGRARWFRLETVRLENGTEDYPRGDSVAAIAPWEATSLWGRLGPDRCNEMLDLIAAGPGPGVLFAAHRRGRGTERWAGRVLIEHCELNEDQAAEVITTWLRTGLLRETSYRCAAQRKTRFGVEVVDGKRPGACTAGQSREDGIHIGKDKS